MRRGVALATLGLLTACTPPLLTRVEVLPDGLRVGGQRFADTAALLAHLGTRSRSRLEVQAHACAATARVIEVLEAVRPLSPQTILISTLPEATHAADCPAEPRAADPPGVEGP